MAPEHQSVSPRESTRTVTAIAVESRLVVQLGEPCDWLLWLRAPSATVIVEIEPDRAAVRPRTDGAVSPAGEHAAEEALRLSVPAWLW